MRTLKEYTRVDNYVDTSNGLSSTKGKDGVRDPKLIKMIVTQEVHDMIKTWMQDILAPQRVTLPYEAKTDRRLINNRVHNKRKY